MTEVTYVYVDSERIHISSAATVVMRDLNVNVRRDVNRWPSQFIFESFDATLLGEIRTTRFGIATAVLRFDTCSSSKIPGYALYFIA